MEEKSNMLHTFSITEREKMIVTGVVDVESFDENEIILYTNDGGINILGEGFKINKLSVDSGDIEIIGYINELKYLNSNQRDTAGFWSKIFK